MTPDALTANQCPVSAKEDSAVGLIGGSLDKRLEHAKVPPLAGPHVLAPGRREDDDARFAAFVQQRPLHVEVGFGRPHHLCDLAAQRPDAFVLGFEIRRRWCADADRRAQREGLANLRVVEGDVRAFMPAFADGSVDAWYILFPDPWWKKKHHKRRIFRPDFIAELHRTLAPGGLLVAKTDVPAYADVIEEELHEAGGFTLAGRSYEDEILGALPRSHREKKCAEVGLPIFQFRFVKVT